jgi:hypothetical protein
MKGHHDYRKLLAFIRGQKEARHTISNKLEAPKQTMTKSETPKKGSDNRNTHPRDSVESPFSQHQVKE